MKILTTWGEANRLATDFVSLCGELGLNPYAMAEGLADSDTPLTIDEDTARRCGLLATKETEQ